MLDHILKWIIYLGVAGAVLLMALVVRADELPFTDENCVRAIIGEASNQGYEGLLYVAVGLRNRGYLKGVYGFKAKHVDKEPKWVWDLARKAWAESKGNRLHSGTHWENLAFGEPYWVPKSVEVARHKDHIFYKELK